MNRKLVWAMVLGLSLASLSHGQSDAAGPAVKGNGTTNFIPVWTSGRSLGNSVMFQSGGSVGLGTTSPQGTLDVESNQTFGIWGSTSSTGLYASGIYGRSASTSGNGVVGEATASSGTNNGVFGRSASPNGFGVSGDATATTGYAAGVYGQTYSPNGAGVSGHEFNTSGVNTGVFGTSASTSGSGVNGYASATSGYTYGVFGSSDSINGSGVFGVANATSGSPHGVVGFLQGPVGVAGQFVTHAGAGLILQGMSGSNFTQVFAVDASGNGYFAGNLNVTGNLSKGSGSFKIDDPLNPANKTLSHSFVESPDMMNIYNGVVQLDAKGAAWVRLPDYFEALNSDFRYQLTAIGAPGPNLYIAQEIAGNRFMIEGGKPGAKVSWQVTGVRCDAYANAHRVPVEEDKAANERGYFLHPDAYGLPPSKGIESAHDSQPGVDGLAAAVAASVGKRVANQ